MDLARKRTRRGSLASLVALFLAAPGCATLLDFQDATDAPANGESVLGAEASTSGTDGTGDGCACKVIPEGWRGPLRRAETAGTPTACAGDFPVLDYDGDRDPQAAAASCTCSCGAPSGVVCGAPEASLFTDAACASTCAGATSTLGSCARITASTPACSASAINGLRVTATTTGGSCAPSTTKQELAKPTWSEHVRLCATTLPTSCDASCDLGACIARAGEHACPSSFPVPHVAYGGVQDSRACTACSCGAPANATCGGTVIAYGSSNCSAVAASAAADGSCIAVTSSSRVTFNAGPASGGSCIAAGGAPTGTVSAQDPTTICCGR